MKLPADILQECPECESWNIRLLDVEDMPVEKYGVEIATTVYLLHCRECGFEWKDYVEDL